ncbi:hypothetical protein, partial [Paludibacterium sp.]|uniref:DUF7343 domain-containing protein n=1 Tax=Paludibacterium sp. TaxID=1917523 RepID=UPI0025E8639F
WSDILEAAASLMARSGQPSLGERIGALNDLISESISVGEVFGAVDVTRRQHVAEALRFLASNGGRAHRLDIGRHLGLGQANLTRVLNMMTAAGLVERSSLGKEAILVLSRAGEAAQRTARADRKQELAVAAP